VVVAVPGEAVESVLVECGERSVGAAVILASGYAETGNPDDAAAQERVRSIGVKYGIKLVGPNCVGVACRPHGLHAAFAEFSPSVLIPGNRVGLVAQSGALGMGLSHAAEHGASISHVLTCGNSCDVDVADYVAYLAEDEDCDAIALAFEGLADPRRLEEAAHIALRNGKRVAACKLATSAAGMAAARFHTGTATGTPEYWSAMFARAGVLNIARIEALMESASFLAKNRRPVAPGAAIISGSGGTAILAVDAAARHGVATPQPGPATMQRLRDAIPSFGSPRNPCDATAQATRNPDSLLACADAMLSDAQYGALVIPWGRAQPQNLMDQLGELALRHSKPVCLVWMSQRLEGPIADAAEAHPSISLFRSLDACFDALGQCQRFN
jgi:acyl-CoA synthetase (NDP forming)